MKGPLCKGGCHGAAMIGEIEKPGEIIKSLPVGIF